MSAREFAPGDVIVHSLGDKLYESTWLRGRDGKWRTDDPASPIYGDEVARGWVAGGGANRLIHTASVRPTPAVQLPETPTLGWATILDPSAGGTRGTELGIWVSADNRGRDGGETDRILQREREFYADHVTAFTPATAVPTSALDELRAANIKAADELDAFIRAQIRFKLIRDFLAAIGTTP